MMRGLWALEPGDLCPGHSYVPLTSSVILVKTLSFLVPVSLNQDNTDNTSEGGCAD